ncbi:hypothetical protein NPX13_g5933 [Xylaria arbuscula]|uniref:NACHT-NTPase and P-loop NTPases N-terminal domain-containing protein n=1 Tax=Xylaria arbuscula TaxID=114810 RepID=A0A9W8NDI8_9PEZI|nr:hypothetical protein NPX13_g5933 [Xylaria arbuscula]
MAELIGVIGSGIAFIELAAKISVCILTIKGRLGEIKDVSNKLSAMMREIQILEPIVEAMAREFSDTQFYSSVCNNDTTFLGITYCERALDELNKAIGDLVYETGASQKLRRYKATMKAIYKGDVLDRCHSRLQSAVHFLNLTQQWYIITLLKAQTRPISQHMPSADLIGRSESMGSTHCRKTTSAGVGSSSVNQQGARRASAIRRARKDQDTSSYSNLWNLGWFGWIAWRYYKEERRTNPKDFNFLARVQANYWFASRVWDIQASRASAGWAIKLNVYCIQPDSAPVFHCARNGDMVGILHLIAHGEASLQDHTPDGQSLLHLAGECGHLELFKTLISVGLDCFESDLTLRVRPCEAMVLMGLRHGVDIPALHCVYLENDIYVAGGLLIHQTEPAYFFEAAATMPPEVVTIIAPFVLPGFYERFSLEERLQYCSFHHPDGYSETLEYLINPSGSVMEDDVSILKRRNICLLTLLSFRYGPMSSKGLVIRTRSFRNLVRRTIHMTEDLSFSILDLDPEFQTREFINKGLQYNPMLKFLQRIQPLTPLFTALSYFRYEEEDYLAPDCTRDLKKRMQVTLKWWLEDLAACQVDLMEYGKRERRFFLHNKKVNQAHYYCGRKITNEKTPEERFDDKVRLVDFDYGARPSDWRLYWDVETERYAGDFWYEIEKSSSE